jgi:uroporphyrinogen decarboxylase
MVTRQDDDMSATDSTSDSSRHQATSRERMLAACRGERVLPVPIWLMRQAGRYLEEYREVRRRVDFLTLCKTADLAAEVTLQPLRRFELDAAILFSDIMVPVEPMGLGLEFAPGPIVEPRLATRADIERLHVPASAEGLEFAIDTVHRIRAAIGEERALIGFAGAPVTLATYMCEGRAAKDFTGLKFLMHSDAQAAHALLEKLARVVTGFLRAQVHAGCDLVQLFDTWAGLLDPFDFDEFVLPHVRAIVRELRDTGVPVVYFCRDASTRLDQLAGIGAQVIGLDWRVDLREARRALGTLTLQGNLDPVLLLGDPDLMRQRAEQILAAGGGTGHVFNLGHGVLPGTPPEHVAELTRAVRAWRPAPAGGAASS